MSTQSLQELFRLPESVLTQHEDYAGGSTSNVAYEDWGDLSEDSEYQGKKVTLNKPFRASGGSHKFYVYVKNEKDNVIKLGFGDPNLSIKRDDPERRKNFRARHNCDNPGPKWKANYWSCRNWSTRNVSDITEAVMTDKDWAKLKKTTWMLSFFTTADSQIKLGAVRIDAPTNPDAVGAVPAAVKMKQYGIYINIRPDGVNGGVNEAGLKRLRIFFHYLTDKKVPYRFSGDEPGKPSAKNKVLWAQLTALLK